MGKKIIRTAQAEYVKWIFDEKQIITIIGLIFMHTIIVRPFLNKAAEMETPINIVEVFLAVANSKMFLLILPILFLILISDFPRIDQNALFFIMRTGRTNWMIGQLLFLAFAVISYLGVLLIYTLTIGTIYGFAGNGWSLVVTNYQAFYGAEAICYIPVELYWQMSPYEAFAKSILLMLGYFMSVGTLLLLFSVYDFKKTGFAVTTAILAAGTATAATNSSFMWFFPTGHAILEKHYHDIKRTVWMEVKYSLIYYVLLIIVLSFLGSKRMRNKSIITIEEGWD